MTEITPEPANGFDYASAPPPIQYYPTPAPSRRGLPWWGWVLIAAGLVLILGVVATGVAVFRDQTKAFSPDYTGAPVEASDAVGDVVVSDSGAVAYAKGPGWVEASDYVDLTAATAELGEGVSVVGIHFTGDPAAAVPQLVLVLEGDPSGSPTGTLKEALDDFLGGVAASATTTEEPVIAPYETANGLQGYVADFGFTASGVDMTDSVLVLGQGRRVVFVQWTSYEGPVDTATRDAFVDTLRIDE
jgi:hypothetical protein